MANPRPTMRDESPLTPPDFDDAGALSPLHMKVLNFLGDGSPAIPAAPLHGTPASVATSREAVAQASLPLRASMSMTQNDLTDAFSRSLDRSDALSNSTDTRAWELQTLRRQLLNNIDDVCADDCAGLESAILGADLKGRAELESAIMGADSNSRCNEQEDPPSPAGSQNRLAASTSCWPADTASALNAKPAELGSALGLSIRSQQLDETIRSESQLLDATFQSQTFLGETLHARFSSSTAHASELKTMRRNDAASLRECTASTTVHACADATVEACEVTHSSQSPEIPAPSRTDCEDDSVILAAGRPGSDALLRTGTADMLEGSTLQLSFAESLRLGGEADVLGMSQAVELKTFKRGLGMPGVQLSQELAESLQASQDIHIQAIAGDIAIGEAALAAELGEASASDVHLDPDDVLRCSQSRLNASKEICQLAAHRARVEAWEHVSSTLKQSPGEKGRAPAPKIPADSGVRISTSSSLGADSCAHTEPTPSRAAAVLPPQLPGRGETGQKSARPSSAQRRGGEEVVVDSPQTVQNRLQRLQAREQKQRSSLSGNRDTSSDQSAAVPSSACPPQPAAAFGSRPPSRPVSAASSVAQAAHSARPPSVDSARPRRVSTASQGRRPSASRESSPAPGAARRSSSAGPGGKGRTGVQSNRKMIRLVLEKHCLKGDVNREHREDVLRIFDQDLAECQRFLICFRSVHTGRHDLRALYGYQEGVWSRVFQSLASPAHLEECMVAQFLRYESGSKEFREIAHVQEMLNVADAVFMQPQYLPKSRVAG